MTLEQFLWIVFALLIGGLLLPLPYALRMAIFLLLVSFVVLTFLTGGMHYLISLTR